MKPQTKLYKITKEELDALTITKGSNMVMVHIPHQNEDTQTESGIYIVGDQDYKPAVHAERWGYVYKVCPDLLYERGRADSMDWKTEVEIEVGDKVWFDFREAVYAYTYLVDGEWYKLIDYAFLHVAVRNNNVIPLNGYVLFREVKVKPDTSLEVEEHVDPRYGIVAYAGSYNQEYTNSVYSDAIRVEEGDHVLFEDGTSCFPLESGLHNEFSDEKFVLQHRNKILAVVNPEHDKIIRLHEMAFGAEIKKRKLEKMGITLQKDYHTYRIGIVRASVLPYLKSGDVVVLPKGKGTLFNDIEYFSEDRIMYYEARD